MDSPTKTGLEISEDSLSFEEISSVSDHNASSSPVTPKSEKIPVAFNFDNGSSDVSPNHESDSPNHESDSSYSELDSEAEAFYSSLNHHLISPGTMELAEKPMSYGELLKKFVQCEEELKTTSLKLQESEQEIEKLKSEAEKKDSTENLRAELETARREIEMRDIEVETEKRRVIEMQRQVIDLETKLSDSSLRIENLVNELNESDSEISKLREMLCDCQQSLALEKANLETGMSGLLETKTLFEARIKELESRGEVLEELIGQSDAEKMEMKSKEVSLQAELNAMKKDLESRDERIEAVNKDFDKHKLRFDMLMAEKDGVSAELDNMKAEMRSRDIQIEQMRNEQSELVTESGNAKNIVEELSYMVKELEKQVELQRNVILEGEEEKREAIRQLCFTLDHYKSGYRQLLRLLSSNNKQQEQAIMVV